MTAQPLSSFWFPTSLKDEEAVKKLTVKPGTKSKLPKPVQELVGMIFDVESMKKALVEYEVGAEAVCSARLLSTATLPPNSCLPRHSVLQNM